MLQELYYLRREIIVKLRKRDSQWCMLWKNFIDLFTGEHSFYKPTINCYCQFFGLKKGVPIHSANRLQRWSVILLNYNFKMQYMPSKKTAHADGLPRLILDNAEALEETVIAALKQEQELKEVLINTVNELPVMLEEIKKTAKMDEYIIDMNKQVKGNEKNKKLNVLPFSICDETLMYAQKVVIPRVLWKKVLKEFHLGHPDISRMKSLMRSFTYWLKMDQDIEDFVRHCEGCQLAAKSPPLRTQPWPKTDIPCPHIHMDYAGSLNGYYYLVIIDSYSKWPEVFKYKHPTATNTIRALNKVFSHLGVPNTIVSDNGTMFTRSEFKIYCHSVAIEHITTLNV